MCTSAYEPKVYDRELNTEVAKERRRHRMPPCTNMGADANTPNNRDANRREMQDAGPTPYERALYGERGVYQPPYVLYARDGTPLDTSEHPHAYRHSEVSLPNRGIEFLWGIVSRHAIVDAVTDVSRQPATPLSLLLEDSIKGGRENA